jgi:hypothetical protein
MRWSSAMGSWSVVLIATVAGLAFPVACDGGRAGQRNSAASGSAEGEDPTSPPAPQGAAAGASGAGGPSSPEPPGSGGVCGTSAPPIPSGNGFALGLQVGSRSANFSGLVLPGSGNIVLGTIRGVTIGPASIGNQGFETEPVLMGTDLVVSSTQDVADTVISMTFPGLSGHVFRAANAGVQLRAECHGGTPSVSTAFRATQIGLDGAESDLVLDGGLIYNLPDGLGTVTVNEIIITDDGSPTSRRVHVNAIHAHTDTGAFDDVFVGEAEAYVACRPGE